MTTEESDSSDLDDYCSTINPEWLDNFRNGNFGNDFECNRPTENIQDENAPAITVNNNNVQNILKMVQDQMKLPSEHIHTNQVIPQVPHAATGRNHLIRPNDPRLRNGQRNVLLPPSMHFQHPTPNVNPWPYAPQYSLEQHMPLQYIPFNQVLPPQYLQQQLPVPMQPPMPLMSRPPPIMSLSRPLPPMTPLRPVHPEATRLPRAVTITSRRISVTEYRFRKEGRNQIPSPEKSNENSNDGKSPEPVFSPAVSDTSTETPPATAAVDDNAIEMVEIIDSVDIVKSVNTIKEEPSTTVDYDSDDTVDFNMEQMFQSFEKDLIPMETTTQDKDSVAEVEVVESAQIQDKVAQNGESAVTEQSEVSNDANVSDGKCGDTTPNSYSLPKMRECFVRLIIIDHWIEEQKAKLRSRKAAQTQLEKSANVQQRTPPSQEDGIVNLISDDEDDNIISNNIDIAEEKHSSDDDCEIISLLDSSDES